MAINQTKYDFEQEGTLGKIKIGETIAKNDLLQLDEFTGKALKVSNVDTAVIGNVDYGTTQSSAATGQISAQVVANGVSGRATSHSRNAIARNSANGFFYSLSSDTGTSGCNISKFNSNGSVIASKDFDTTASASTNHHIFVLPNNNVAVVYSISGNLVYAVFDANLVEVKAITTVAAIGTVFFGATGISAGGFAVVYQDNTNALKSRLAVYDNTGTATLAPTDIWTRTGTSATQYHRMIELSDGKLIIAVSSTNTVSTIGLYYGIFNTSGATTKAFTLLDAVSAATIPEISSLSGYFAVARNNATDVKAWVLNNAGTIQGAEFSTATSSSGSNRTKIVNDGSIFWLLWSSSVELDFISTKLPLTGTNYSSNNITLISGTSQYNQVIDAFYENGLIVGISAATSTNRNNLWVIDSNTGLLINPNGTLIGSAAATTNGGLYLRIIPGGDRSYIAMYDYTTTASTLIFMGKYSRTSIIGIANSSGVANDLIPVKTTASFNYINPIVGGSNGSAFDMSTNTLVGNKGSIIKAGGVVLKGLGV